MAGAVLTDLGVALRGARRFDEAISAHESAAAIAQKAGHRDLEATATHDLEDTRAARDGTAQDDPRDHLNPAHLAGDALNDRGLSLQRSGSFEEAETVFREAAAIFQRLGDRRDEGAALCNVGICLRKRGLQDQAIDVLGQALILVEDDTCDRDLTGRIVQELGGALTDHGIALVEQRRFPDAIATHERAAVLLREQGDRHGEGCASPRPPPPVSTPSPSSGTPRIAPGKDSRSTARAGRWLGCTALRTRSRPTRRRPRASRLSATSAARARR
jgi:tetratricopeptide (TPR) repeat protein